MNAALLLLSTRGVVRHRRRTIVLAVALAAGLVTTALALGLERWTSETLLALTARTAGGHGFLERPGFHRSRALALRFPAEADPVDTTRLASGPVRLLPLLEFPALLASKTEQAPVQVQGRGPVQVVGPALSPITPPRVADDDGPGSPHGLTLQAALAEQLGVSVGDRVHLRFVDGRGDERDVPVSVGSIRTVAATGFDRGIVRLPLADAQALIGEPSLTSWAVRVSGTSRDAVLAQLDDVRHSVRTNGLELVTWRETAPDVEGIRNAQSRVIRLLIGALVGALVINISNAFSLGLFDRTREFGVLAALGLRPRQLRDVIQLEALLTGAAGTLLGVLAVLPVSWFFRVRGLDFSGSASSLELSGQVLPPVVHAYIGPVQIAWAAVLVALITPLAGMLPARHIARLDPIDAVRTA